MSDWYTYLISAVAIWCYFVYAMNQLGDRNFCYNNTLCESAFPKRTLPAPRDQQRYLLITTAHN